MKDINGRRRAQFTQADHEYYARLRDELARGPKGMCDPLEYAPLDENERRILELKEKGLRDKLHDKMDKLTGRTYGTVHGSDIRSVGETDQDNRQSAR
jgi:hypothetical protein